MVAIQSNDPSVAYTNICSHMARTTEEFGRVKQLMRDGFSDYAIARLTGIPRPTVRHWRQRELPPGRRSWHVRWQAPDRFAYAYLLGCYLGDGTITHRSRNGWEHGSPVTSNIRRSWTKFGRPPH
jgi:Homeodomain-like domain-containing protein